MNDKILLTMESQHGMSSTMLDMRKQFEQLSQFMTAIMADKLEIAMTRHHTDGTTNSAAGTSEYSRANKRTQHSTLDRQNRRHLRTHHKILAFTDSLRKRNITKAIKQHSIDDDEHDTSTDADMIDTGRLELIEGLAYQYDKTEGSANKGHNGEDPEDMSDSSDVCLNLEDAFKLQKQEEHNLHQANEQ